MTKKAQFILSVLKEVGSEFSRDKCMQLAAALAYYSIFSLAPLLVILIAIVGFIFGEEAARGEMEGQISGLVGDRAAGMIQTMIAQTSETKSNIWASVIGGATLLFGASGVFGQLKQSLNQIWETPPATGGGVKGFIKQRALSFSMILVIGFLLLISLVLSAVLSALGGYLEQLLPFPPVLLQWLSFALSFAVITLLFALIYRILPDALIQWRSVWLGAAMTALLFTIGKTALGWYLGRQGVASSYGAAGSFVVLLMWIYYSSVILFLGAEFTEVIARRLGHGIRARHPADAENPG